MLYLNKIGSMLAGLPTSDIYEAHNELTKNFPHQWPEHLDMYFHACAFRYLLLM